MVIDGNRRVAEVARELDLHENLLHKWVRDERRRMAAAGAGGRPDPGGGEPLSADERAERSMGTSVSGTLRIAASREAQFTAAIDTGDPSTPTMIPEWLGWLAMLLPPGLLIDPPAVTGRYVDRARGPAVHRARGVGHRRHDQRVFIRRRHFQPAGLRAQCEGMAPSTPGMPPSINEESEQ